MTLYKSINPFSAVNFSGIFKFFGYRMSKFDNFYFSSRVKYSMVFFTFLIFIRFFYFLFFFIFNQILFLLFCLLIFIAHVFIFLIIIF